MPLEKEHGANFRGKRTSTFRTNLAIKRRLSLTHVKNWDPIGPKGVVSVWQLQQIQTVLAPLHRCGVITIMKE
ncbi:hypothetical protein L1887_30277 [Cichorium endivia]|nr:hypothetical protein L1887_30277 [Cichorium endivia]